MNQDGRARTYEILATLSLSLSRSHSRIHIFYFIDFIFRLYRFDAVDIPSSLLILLFTKINYNIVDPNEIRRLMKLN